MGQNDMLEIEVPNIELDRGIELVEVELDLPEVEVELFEVQLDSI